MSGWNGLGLAVAAGLPLAVFLAAVFWPAPEDPDDREDSNRADR